MSTLPPTIPPESVDPDAGFLCMTTPWRPNPTDPDPNMPGQKLSMAGYLSVLPGEDCLCGSGKAYRDCCRPRRYWHPICPNAIGSGYSLVSSQSATFRDVAGEVIRERLMADARLHCVEDVPERSF